MISNRESTASPETLMALASVRVQTVAAIPDDGYVYTLGHGRLGRPDLIAVCGSALDGAAPAMDLTQLSSEVNAAARMVRWIIDHWTRLEVTPGAMFRSDTHRVFKVADEDSTGELLDDVLASMEQGGRGLVKDELRPIVLVPVGRARWH